MPEKKLSKESIRDLIIKFFNELIPFNKLIEMKVDSTFTTSEVRIKMKPDLIGNTVQNILHGGVISAVLDVAGGVVAMVNMSESLVDKDDEYVRKRLTTTGTIDLRIDYLMPGRGEEFIASAKIIRSGNKVTVTRMELHNEKGEQIALGTATYLVG